MRRSTNLKRYFCTRNIKQTLVTTCWNDTVAQGTHSSTSRKRSDLRKHHVESEKRALDCVVDKGIWESTGEVPTQHPIRRDDVEGVSTETTQWTGRVQTGIREPDITVKEGENIYRWAPMVGGWRKFSRPDSKCLQTQSIRRFQGLAGLSELAH